MGFIGIHSLHESCNMREVERRRTSEEPWSRQRSVEEHQPHEEAVQPARGGFPRWPAAVALLIIGALYAVISRTLTLGPRIFLPGLVLVLLIPIVFAHQRRRHDLARWIALGLVSIVTAAVVISVLLLIFTAFSGETS